MTDDRQEHKAETFARNAFKDTVDRLGRPSILHVESVVAACRTPAGRTVAWLHDIVEDTATTLADLHLEGFDEDIVDNVDALTRRPNESYAAYIDRAKVAGKVVIEVKHADLSHNRSRTHELSCDAAENLNTRYDAALAIIGPLDIKTKRKNRPVSQEESSTVNNNHIRGNESKSEIDLDQPSNPGNT